MKNDHLRQLERRGRAVLCAPRRRSTGFARGEACTLIGLDGNDYIDLASGFGVANTGWGHPAVIQALHAQLDEATFAPPWLLTAEAVELAEVLVERAPPSVGWCLRATGGADANEGALRAAAQLGERRILSHSMAYHGGTALTRSLGRLGAADPRYLGETIPPAYCFRCLYGLSYPACDLACAMAVDERLSARPSKYCAVIVEPVIGSGGVIVPPPQYHRRLREICTRHGAALVFDEVLTGVGRLGALFAAQLYDVAPDAITLGKGLSAGHVPIGAALLSDELSDAIAGQDDVTATFAWTPLACRAALANLEVVERGGLARRARRLGAELKRSLEELFRRHLADRFGEVRGEGLLIGIELVTGERRRDHATRLNARIVLEALKRGLVLAASWDLRYLIVAPPLVIDQATIDEALDRLESTLRRLRR